MIPSRWHTVRWQPTGERIALPDLAGRYGLKPSVVRQRWQAAGCPQEAGPDLVRPVAQRAERVLVDYPPHGVVGFGKIREIHAHLHRSRFWFVSRWEQAGRPLTVTAELFADASAPDDNPALAHIPCGDLAHLSGTKNTGAGRGEIPLEEWVKRHGRVRSSLASAYRRIMLYQGSQQAGG